MVIRRSLTTSLEVLQQYLDFEQLMAGNLLIILRVSISHFDPFKSLIAVHIRWFYLHKQLKAFHVLL
jgi:hypothetical protein